MRLSSKKPDGTFLGNANPFCSTSTQFVGISKSQLPAVLTMTDCQSPPDVTVWSLTETEITCISGICPSVVFVGGEFIGVDSTSLLVAGAQTNAAWMIPVLISAIGIAIVIARKF